MIFVNTMLREIILIIKKHKILPMFSLAYNQKLYLRPLNNF